MVIEAFIWIFPTASVFPEGPRNSHFYSICPVLRCSVMSNSLRPHGLYPARPLCPWDFPGKNTGVGHHFLLQGIFPVRRSKLHLLFSYIDRRILYRKRHLGSPISTLHMRKINNQQVKPVFQNHLSG